MAHTRNPGPLAGGSGASEIVNAGSADNPENSLPEFLPQVAVRRLQLRFGLTRSRALLVAALAGFGGRAAA